MSRFRRLASHAVLALAEGSLIALLVVGLAAGTALAAKGGNGGGGSGGGGGAGGGAHSVSVVMVADANTDGLPSWGDTITFVVTTSAARPFVSLNCYQGESWVYAASVGYFADYPWSKNMILAASSWTGGAASCVATLYTSKDGIRTTTLATLRFVAER